MSRIYNQHEVHATSSTNVATGAAQAITPPAGANAVIISVETTLAKFHFGTHRDTPTVDITDPTATDYAMAIPAGGLPLYLPFAPKLKVFAASAGRASFMWLR